MATLTLQQRRPFLAARQSSISNGTPAAVCKLIAQQKLPAWSDAKETAVKAPYCYLLSFPGKDVRSQLIEALNQWLQVARDYLEIIQHVISMLHNASLLIDDIEDASELRRGHAAAHLVYGIPQTLNSANYVYFEALEALYQLPEEHILPCLRIFTDELLNLHRGQGMDLFWRDSKSGSVPGIAEYLSMVGNKTGGLFRLAMRLMKQLSPNCQTSTAQDFSKLAEILGILFQIRDDYQNLKSDQYTDSKGFCEDLTEGKFSFPIIHAIRRDKSGFILDVLRQKTTDVKVKERVVALMQELGSFQYTLETIQVLAEEGKGLISKMGGNEGLEKLLEKLRV